MSLTKRQLAPAMAFCVAFVAAATLANKMAAGNADEFSVDYPYLVVDQALPEVLRALGHNLDMAVDVSPGIKGRLRHYRHDGSANDFLTYLQTEHQLDWIIDGQRLFFSSAKEQISRSWPAGDSALTSAEAALSKASIDDQRYPIEIDRSRGQISLTAPPRHMARVTPVIDRALAPKATRTVNVIHGRQRAGGT